MHCPLINTLWASAIVQIQPNRREAGANLLRWTRCLLCECLIKDIFHLEQKLRPCQVGGDNGRLNFTSGGLKETQMFHKDCLWFVASLRKFGWHSLWLPPSQVQEFMQVLEQFGRLSASVFSFIYVIAHVGRRALKSIKSISVQALFPVNWEELRIQGRSTKS